MKMIENSQSTYYLPKVETKDYNVMINGKNFFNHPINCMNKTYENIRKTATGQRDDYTTGCLIDYSYFKDHNKMIDIDLSKQQALDADPRAIQQINFTANLDRAGNTTMFFIIEEAKETVLDFSQGTVSFVSAIPLNAKYSLIFINIKNDAIQQEFKCKPTEFAT